MREELAVTSFDFEDGRVAIPDAPGLGVELDANVVERYRAKPNRRMFHAL